MRSLVTISLLLALASSAFGGVTLATMQEQVLTRLHINAQDGDRLTSVVDVRNAINRGIVETCRKYPAIEKRDTVVVTDTGGPPALPADFDRLHAALRLSGDSLRIPLTVIADVALMPTLFSIMATNRHIKLLNGQVNRMSPSACYTYGGYFEEHPKFASSQFVDSVELMYYAIGPSVSSTSDTCPVSPGYVERVMDFACMLIAKSRGDEGSAADFYQWFLTGTAPVISREAEGKR
jgi:hypothetical protein